MVNHRIIHCYTVRVSITLTTPLAKVLRTTHLYLETLETMGMRTVEDLLLYLPRAHEDLTQMQTLRTAPINTKVTMRGTIDQLKLVRLRGRKYLVSGHFTDNEGDSAEVTWFNQPHIMRMLQNGQDVVLTGKITEEGRKVKLQSPQFERELKRPLVHTGRLVPIYPQHEIITTKWLREKMVLVKSVINQLPETLPKEILREESLMSRHEAIQALHFPVTADELNRAEERMSFERMYAMQLGALLRKKQWQAEEQKRLQTPMDIELIRALFASLNFTPTDSQRVAIYEILRDMERTVPMSRLLEGDVGSGKTLVAVAVMANVLASSGQCALMVPTEVLARQHAMSITKLLLNLHAYLLNIRKIASGPAFVKASAGKQWPVANEKSKINNQKSVIFPLPTLSLLTGSIVKSEADDIKKRLATGTIDIAIGTHALIEENVRFKDLRLVIVDEQHRFGVLQRERLREKGSPHFLSMTATPIPRTLALTAYGDHDLSVLLEKPGRRQAIETRVIAPNDRKTVEHFIDHQINEGRQVFVICPLIRESTELAEVKNVTAEMKRLTIEFPRRTVAMLHGKLTSEEKQKTMQDFRDKKSDILVSTSVIEVGIDIPNATIIIIEGAERFGLAQLHQLRGRVGRGEHKSYCFLFTTSEQQAASPRLRAMEKHDSGFMLAEIDLKLRGPGELYGLRQSGIPEMILQGMMNPGLIARARKAAEKMLV